MSLVAWLVPGPVHALVALGALACVAWRRRPSLGYAHERLLVDDAGRLTDTEHRERSAWRWPLLGLFVVAWMAATPGFAEWGLRALEGPLPETGPGLPEGVPTGLARDESTLIVVLASGEMHAPDGRPDVRLDIHGVERLRAGVALWGRTGGRLLLTGGPGTGRDDSIASLMQRLAIDLGVPAAAIDLAPGSRTTYEDLSIAKDRLAKHQGPRWLVTSASHMPRSLAVARKAGLDLQPLRTDYRQIRQLTVWSWLPDPQAQRRLVPVLHEWVGLWIYQLRGWAA